MFHLLVKYDGWAKGHDTMPLGRWLEYTSDNVAGQFRVASGLDAEHVMSIPALFVSEVSGSGDQVARVGSLTKARVVGKEIALDYVLDDTIPGITNARLQDLSVELDISDFEFSRTHWAIKDVDLFRVLLRDRIASHPAPKVFKVDPSAQVEQNLLSVMMPFRRTFDGVYQVIHDTCDSVEMACLRADDIWENEEVIQDIFALINRSRIVVCDCTGRNPNVFYEAGIAHTLGRSTVLIAQSAEDVPFDLRHLRFVEYQDTAEGRKQLGERLKKRIKTILAAK